MRRLTACSKEEVQSTLSNAPPDYQSLIDEETWAFIRRTEQYFPQDGAALRAQEQRAFYDAMCREFHQGYPDGVIAGDDDSGVPTRHYHLAPRTATTTAATADADEPIEPVAQIVYFHGGGFVVGGLESHDDVCAELCAITGFALTAVDYRLCPEHRHPAAFEDALAAVKKVWARQQLPILLCGDSAGGNLAAAVAHHLRSQGDTGNPIEVAGQVLIYPGLGGDLSTGSYVRHHQAPMLTTEGVKTYTKLRLPTEDSVEDATSAPLLDTCFSGLPDTYIVSAECDPLSDDGQAYRDAIIDAGGKAVWVNEPGLVHGYLRARTTVRRARESFDRIAQALSGMGRGQWERG